MKLQKNNLFFKYKNSVMISRQINLLMYLLNFISRKNSTVLICYHLYDQYRLITPKHRKIYIYIYITQISSTRSNEKSMIWSFNIVNKNVISVIMFQILVRPIKHTDK